MKKSLLANWFTRSPHQGSSLGTLLVTMLVYGLSFLQLERGAGLAASNVQVFWAHEWWRAWSALFVHADLVHLFSNTPLLVLFTYLLWRFFGPWMVASAFALCGFMNLVVLATMPPETNLLGASGVVHFMGALWLTLYVAIERRDELTRRFGAALFLTLMLFTPDVYRPEVSYLSHLLGYVMGLMWGGAIALFGRNYFASFERWLIEPQVEPDFEWRTPEQLEVAKSLAVVRTLEDETP
jgi:rhomboid protease GluP